MVEDEVKLKKDFLRRYLKSVRKIERLESKLFDIDEKMEGLKSQTITDMPRGGRAITLDDMLIRKEEIEDRINFLSIDSRKIRKEICQCLDQLEEAKQVDVMEAYFIDGLTIAEIADDLGYNHRYVYKLYSDGVSNLELPE